MRFRPYSQVLLIIDPQTFGGLHSSRRKGLFETDTIAKRGRVIHVPRGSFSVNALECHRSLMMSSISLLWRQWIHDLSVPDSWAVIAIMEKHLFRWTLGVPSSFSSTYGDSYVHMITILRFQKGSWPASRSFFLNNLDLEWTSKKGAKTSKKRRSIDVGQENGVESRFGVIVITIWCALFPLFKPSWNHKARLLWAIHLPNNPNNPRPQLVRRPLDRLGGRFLARKRDSNFIGCSRGTRPMRVVPLVFHSHSIYGAIDSFRSLIITPILVLSTRNQRGPRERGHYWSGQPS